MLLDEWGKLHGLKLTSYSYLEIKKAFLDYGIKEYPFKVIVERNKKITMISLNYKDLVSYSDWDDIHFPKCVLYFKNENDAILFKLKWA